MPRMSQINIKKSKYFKIKELEEATGESWGKAFLIVTVEQATVEEYPAEDGKEPEPAFLLHFAGHAKPLGCNLTNRKTIQGIMGDVEWDTAALAGMQLQLYAVSTERGAGIRVQYCNELAAASVPAAPTGGDPVHDSEPPNTEGEPPPF